VLQQTFISIALLIEALSVCAFRSHNQSMRFLLLALALLLVGCAPRTETPAGPEEQYPLRGEVVGLDPEGQIAKIKHEEIKGWMDAMTMDFHVRDKAEFEKLQVGDRISGTVYVRDLDYRLGDIRTER
jgi:Cu/Ag efflux protein CusF